MSSYEINISMHHKIDISKTQNLKKLKQSCDDFESEILNFYLKNALNFKINFSPKAREKKFINLCIKRSYQKA